MTRPLSEAASPRLFERVAVATQHLLPKQAMTRFAGLVARAQMGAITSTIIARFIARYGVNMAEAQVPEPAAYASFNDFFTRALRSEERL